MRYPARGYTEPTNHQPVIVVSITTMDSNRRITKNFRLRSLLLIVAGCAVLIATVLPPITARNLEKHLLSQIPVPVHFLPRDADAIRFC